jgi:5'-AMP-activated protein kinase catalytic alpha subunit
MKAVVMVNRMKRFSLSSKASEDNDGHLEEGDVHLEGLGGSDAGEQQPSSTYVEHKFASRWLIGEKLGEGAFAEVHLCTSLKDHSRQCAVKILSKKKMKEDDHASVLREVEIMRKLQHPNIVQFLDYFDESGSIYIVEECLSGGELFDRIVKKEHYSEKEARDVVFYFLKGLQHCHSHGVVHRDLKPENLLLASKDDDENVKIADFGLSNVAHDGDFLRTSCGSPNYAAPEVISGNLYAGPEVDVWSCGVILYALLCGTLPFDDESIPNLFKKIKSGMYSLPSHLSQLSRDLILRMLVVVSASASASVRHR